MKLAAVLVPLVLFLLPTISHAIFAGWFGIKGNENKLERPLSNRGRKQFLIAAFVYIAIIFPASIAWSVYVFTNNVWFSVIAYFIWMIPIVIAVPMYRHISATIPKPPPGGWPDDKTKLDAIRKWQADREEGEYKRINKAKWWIVGIFAFIVLLLIIMAIAVPIMIKLDWPK